MHDNQCDRLIINTKTKTANNAVLCAAKKPSAVVSTRKNSLSKLLLMASAVPLSSMAIGIYTT